MKNRLLQFAGVLAIFAVVGKFYAVPLIAQIRAALVKNVDEPGRSPYEQGAYCSTQSVVCNATFAAVPANKRLVVETFSAFAQISPNNVLIVESFVGEGSQAGPFLPAQLYVQPLFDSYISNYGIQYNFLAKADHFFEPGTTPSFTLGGIGATTISFSATLTGYLVDLTQ